MKKTQITCPRCGQKTFWQENPCRPFCSDLCRQIDLGRWASEDYAIAGQKAPQPEEDNQDY